MEADAFVQFPSQSRPSFKPGGSCWSVVRINRCGTAADGARPTVAGSITVCRSALNQDQTIVVISFTEGSASGSDTITPFPHKQRHCVSVSV